MIIEIKEKPKFKFGDIVIKNGANFEKEIITYRIVKDSYLDSFTCYPIFENSFYSIKKEDCENEHFNKLHTSRHVIISGNKNMILYDDKDNNFLCETTRGGSVILETEYNKNNKLIVKKLKPFENPNDITLSRVRFYGDLILRNSED
jgi:hypothetical protein